jgi:hypothetical protein
MIKLNFKEPNTEKWKAWKEKCETAIVDIILLAEQGKPFKVDGKLYAAQKEELLKASYRKCAFCEADISRQHGDVEHFRPKKTATDEKNKKVCRLNADGSPVLNKDGKPDLHKGYYWLAYDWTNLLPACVKCNQSNKKNRFPVKGFRAYKPGEEAREDPLLLNPMYKDPKKHFKLDAELGILSGITDEGKMCIDVFKLNDESLMDSRRKAYFDLVARIKLICSEFDPEEEMTKKVQEAFREVFKCYKGSGAFAFASRHALKEHRELLHEIQEYLPFSLKSIK